MTESNNRELVKPGDPRMLKRVADIQQQLLLFRFNSYNSIRPAVIPGDENLRPRSRDILQCLAAPLVGNQQLSRMLLDFFRRFHDPSTREALSPMQDALLAALFQFAHFYHKVPCIRTKDLAEATNLFLRKAGERLAVTDRKAGYLISTLGFRNKQRTNLGWILWLDAATRERLHQLLKTNGNAYLNNVDFEKSSKSCSVCGRLTSPPESKLEGMFRAS